MSESLKDKIFSRMQELDIQPKRSLGQNFLVNQGVVDKIVQSAEAQKFENVFEIGPGLGALTDSLREMAQNFTVVELDKTFAQYWREEKLPVLEVDALKLDWNQAPGIGKNNLLVSNLPYQISARVVVDFSTQYQIFSRMVLMFQKEVAQRIQAAPSTSEYGLLSVVAQSYWQIEKVADVGTVDFYPKPNVASRVLRFDAQFDKMESLNSLDYLNFLKICFANRRKMLLPKLNSFRSKAELEKIFQELHVSEQARAETLSWQHYRDLYRALKTE